MIKWTGVIVLAVGITVAATGLGLLALVAVNAWM